MLLYDHQKNKTKPKTPQPTLWKKLFIRKEIRHYIKVAVDTPCVCCGLACPLSWTSRITPTKPSGVTGFFYLIITRARLSIIGSTREDTTIPHILWIYFHSNWSSLLKDSGQPFGRQTTSSWKQGVSLPKSRNLWWTGRVRDSQHNHTCYLLQVWFSSLSRG